MNIDQPAGHFAGGFGISTFQGNKGHFPISHKSPHQKHTKAQPVFSGRAFLKSCSSIDQAASDGIIA
jgi:hypothetical protein